MIYMSQVHSALLLQPTGTCSSLQQRQHGVQMCAISDCTAVVEDTEQAHSSF
jgi:hypothetical protein